MNPTELPNGYTWSYQIRHDTSELLGDPVTKFYWALSYGDDIVAEDVYGVLTENMEPNINKYLDVVFGICYQRALQDIKVSDIMDAIPETDWMDAGNKRYGVHSRRHA